MAAAAAAKSVEAGDAPPAKRGASIVVQLGLLLAMTAAAGGMGWVSGGFLTSGRLAAGGADHAQTGTAHGGGAKPGEHGAAGGDHGAVAASETVIPLSAITTNIASPKDVWVRMEVSIVLDEPQDVDLPGTIQQDLLTYMRTVKMHEVEGASGFRHLRENLEERAAIRSDGHVKQVLIRTLLFE
ncbi:MAG: flagellar basal body-associated FliL family protein [Hyphomicrobiales bacterium]|nr:flagellar basal body-associated FliL family protein [Hyphomicrobiales bacterium]